MVSLATKRINHRTTGIVLAMLVLAVNCSASDTDHIPVVTEFDVTRFLGTWYEIVRSDHRFERGLSHVTATYLEKGPDRIKVINRGFKDQKNNWKESTARGYLNPESTSGEFAVSFFWPFKARYRIIELDPEYQYAVVTSNSMDYFWILSRSMNMGDTQIEEILQRAKKWGFKTDQFIRVEHTEGRHSKSPFK